VVRQLPFISAATQALLAKEFGFFFRDRSQWPQLLLVFVLAKIYLYNFSVLPLDKSPIQPFYLQHVFTLRWGAARLIKNTMG